MHLIIVLSVDRESNRDTLFYENYHFESAIAEGYFIQIPDDASTVLRMH